MSSTTPEPKRTFSIRRVRTKILGLSLDQCIQAFFGGHALTAVIVLTLITVFLFKEGIDFFGQNRENLRIYRQSGMEYVDVLRELERDHTSLTRYLYDIRLRALQHLTGPGGRSLPEANAALADLDALVERFGDAVVPIRGFVSDYGEVAVGIKTRFIENQDFAEAKRQYLAAGMVAEAEAIAVAPIDFKAEVAAITGAFPEFEAGGQDLAREVASTVQQLPALPTPDLQKRLERFQQLAREYAASIDGRLEQMRTWQWDRPVPATQAFTAFIFGRQWLTASFWQDWYGIVPLFVGSLMVSVIALSLAVPLGIGAAIYVNQFASRREQQLIKPTIEFISAIPSVVLGFFGIAVLGQALRALSQAEWLAWVPGFPFAERLNALTAGCLLALIAVPTIFTLAEDAINNVPRAFREASYALGASRLQTIIRIIVPASLSGIISAVLLGLGRVIGETMVVLLCAGNRIAIPDFTQGLTAFVQPVHTMTGIIAQEMGEVVRGSIHYRALFVVGIVLFFVALLINFLAQKIVRRHRISIG